MNQACIKSAAFHGLDLSDIYILFINNTAKWPFVCEA